jgi:alpha-tubulin suppressor-like RCC1 family protein
MIQIKIKKTNIPNFHDHFQNLNEIEYEKFGIFSVSNSLLNWTVPAYQLIEPNQLMLKTIRSIDYGKSTQIVVNSNGIEGTDQIQNGIAIYFDSKNYILYHSVGTVGKLKIIRNGQIVFNSGSNTVNNTTTIKLMYNFETKIASFFRWTGSWSNQISYTCNFNFLKAKLVIGCLNSDGSNTSTIARNIDYVYMTDFNYSTQFPDITNNVLDSLKNFTKNNGIVLNKKTIPDLFLSSFGNNEFGQLGLNTLTSDFNTPQNFGIFDPVIENNFTYNDWKKISTFCNGSFSLLLKRNNTLWAIGDNSYGQFGNDTNNNEIAPKQIIHGLNIKDINVGESHSFIVTEDGIAYGAGSNMFGQLGIGTDENRQVFLKIENFKWKKICAGSNFSIGLREDGTLWGAGLNSSGQLGNGTTNQSLTFVKIGNHYWKDISCGANFSLGIRFDGTLWGWGSNFNYQLGVTGNTSKLTPVQIGSSTNWIKIFTGFNFSFALNSENQLYACGDNSFGQLGLNDLITRQSLTLVSDLFTEVSCGYGHTLFLTKTKDVYSTGLNSFGQLGLSNNVNKIIPEKINTINSDIKYLILSCGQNHSIIGNIFQK